MADALSDVLGLVAVRSARCTRFEAGGRWALRFPAKPALKFVAVLRGACWILPEGGEPQALREGDTFLLANAPPYVLANDREVPPADGLALFDWGRADAVRHGGADTAMLAGSFVFDPEHAPLLLDGLPGFLRIAAAPAGPSTLRWILEILDVESRRAEAGTTLVTRRLAEVLLVQALRAYIARHGREAAGWLGAVADPRLGAALNAVHGDIARPWTVEDLAQAAGMSRSAFAAAFRRAAGVPPLTYVADWRMQLARAALRRGDRVAQVAERVGYASESAFGNAFKRRHGLSPKRYAASASPPADAGQA